MRNDRPRDLASRLRTKPLPANGRSARPLLQPLQRSAKEMKHQCTPPLTPVVALSDGLDPPLSPLRALPSSSSPFRRTPISAVSTRHQNGRCMACSHEHYNLPSHIATAGPHQEAALIPRAWSPRRIAAVEAHAPSAPSRSIPLSWSDRRRPRTTPRHGLPQ